jgi:hypothetical protein
LSRGTVGKSVSESPVATSLVIVIHLRIAASKALSSSSPPKITEPGTLTKLVDKGHVNTSGVLGACLDAIGGAV